MNQEQLSNSQDIYIDQVIFSADALYEIPPEQIKKGSYHQFIGSLLFRSKQIHIQGKGTGILISPNLLLTTAHNVYNFRTKEHYFDIFFNFQPYSINQRKYQVQQYYFPQKYTSTPTFQFDYALLKLKVAIEMPRFIPLSSENIEKQSKISVFGYPTSKYFKKSKETDVMMARQCGLLKPSEYVEVKKQKRAIFHRISTMAGQSGAPILLHKGDQIKIIGIHKGACQQGQSKDINCGVLVTDELINDLKKQSMKMNAESFCVQEKQNQVSPLDLKPQKHKPNLEIEIKLNKTTQDNKKSEEFDLIFQKLPKNQDTKTYLSLIQQNPKLFQPYINIGNTLNRQGHNQQAIKCYQKALDLNSKSIEAYYGLGNVFFQQKKYKEAIKCYQSIIEMSPQSQNAFNKLGNVLYTINQYQNAIQAYRKAIQINKKYKYPYNGLGNVFRKLNHIEQAIKYYLKAIELDPEDRYPFVNLEKINFDEDNQHLKQQIGSFMEKIVKRSVKGKLALEYLKKMHLETTKK